jgi:hypothetical protein
VSVDTIEQATAHPNLGVYRSVAIKRRSITTGLFETSWFDISEDVKKWGVVRVNGADSDRRGVLTLDAVRMVFQNDEGKYNPSSDDASNWFGYMDQQRTLVRIKAGLFHQSVGADGIWVRHYFPGSAQWDQGQWDKDSWDSDDQIFTGIIAGEIYLSDTNEVTFQIKPLTQVFQDFPAAELTGLNPSITASGFITLLRDQTDGSGNFIFRPFFGDTTSNWDITATTNVYSDLDTTTAQQVRNSTVWEIVEKLAEAENYAAYVDQVGVLHFVPKTATTDVAWEFNGLGTFDQTYGHTIKKIERYGKDFQQYYSRVLVQFAEDDTSTSYASTSGGMQVTAVNTAWALGARTLQIQNFWIPDSASAGVIAGALYAEYGALKDVIEFTTSFVPHLTIFDRIAVNYDSTSRAVGNTVWDANDWDTELTWDDSRGDAIVLEEEEFKFLTIEMNLDTLECKFKARAI